MGCDMSIVAVIDKKQDGYEVRVPIDRAELPSQPNQSNDRIILLVAIVVAVLVATQVVGGVFLWRVQMQTTDGNQQWSDDVTSIRADVRQLQNVTGEFANAIET